MDMPLSEAYTVVLDGSGNGTVLFGPNRLGQMWVPTMTVAVSTSTAVKVPEANLYLGSTFLGGTYTGSNDSTDLPGVTVYAGQQIKVVWTGGDAGAVATASVSGTVRTPG